MKRKIGLRFAALAMVAIVAACGGDDDPPTRDATELDAGDVDRYEVDSRNHVTGTVDYPQTPPVGGDHADAWMNCGVYDEPLVDENAVHSLEHGAVWVTYDPAHDADEVEALEALADGETHVLVSPHPDQVDPIIVSAWGAQMSALSADDPRIDAFIDEFQEGPDTPEPGAPCSGALGSPR